MERLAGGQDRFSFGTGLSDLQRKAIERSIAGPGANDHFSRGCPRPGDFTFRCRTVFKALKAASLSAAFLLFPLPRPSSTPFWNTAHSNSRSWSGPVTDVSS